MPDLPPIHRCPPEILSKIFVACVEDFTRCGCLWSCDFDAWRDDAVQIMLQPSYLISVCCRWRDVTYATPHLWNTLFSIGIPGRRPGALLHRFRQCLSRSGDLDIFLEINGYRAGPFELLVDFLKEYSTRITRLRMLLPDHWEPLFLPSGLHFPNLHTLSIPEGALETEMGGRLQNKVFPRLRAFHPQQFRASMATCNWSAVTTVEFVTVYSYDPLFKILSSTPSLINLRICLLNEIEQAFQHGFVTLPCLQTLDVGAEAVSTPSVLFGGLTTPRLQLLRCVTEWMEGEQSIAVDVFKAFVSRSGCSPRVVILSRTAATPDAVLLEMHRTVPRSHMIQADICVDFDFMHAIYSDWDLLCPHCRIYLLGHPYSCRSSVTYLPPAVGHDVDTCTICP